MSRQLQLPAQIGGTEANFTKMIELQTGLIAFQMRAPI